MATILSSHPTRRQHAPGSTRLARWLDQGAPVVILAGMLAILAAAAGEARACDAAMERAPAMAMAE